MSSSSGYTFVDDSQMSVCEKINKYFAKKTSNLNINESTSDSSFDSFSQLDDSFADVLNRNAHVTLLRQQKKEKENSLCVNKPGDILAGPNTNHSEATHKLRRDDSFKCNTNDWWNRVSDESFLEVERQCNQRESFDRKYMRSLEEKDTTLLFDIEEPSFFANDISMSGSILSPIKQVALRRPSTIAEESTLRSSSSSDECNDVSSSSSLKKNLKYDEPTVTIPKSNVYAYRPSMINVFPTRSRKNFYDNLETVTSSTVSSAKESTEYKGNENEISIDLMTFDDSVLDISSSSDHSENISSLDNESSDQFNDTLEAVDYYMEQGKKILDKTSTPAPTPQAIYSPKNRNHSLLKQTLERRHLESVYQNFNK